MISYIASSWNLHAALSSISSLLGIGFVGGVLYSSAGCRVPGIYPCGMQLARSGFTYYIRS